jgi:FkbM family methyltransferase
MSVSFSTKIGRLINRLNHSPLARARLTVWDARMFSYSFDRTLYLVLHKCGLMGADDRAQFEEWIKPGMTVVDVGANIGVYTGLFSRLVGPGGKVIAIEPAEDNWRALQCAKEANRWDNVELHKVAVSDRSGPVFVSYGAVNSGNTTVSRERSGASSHAAEAVSLDDIVAGRRVDFLKIDVQGWEAHVLRGACATVTGNRPLRVRLEILPRALRAAGSSPDEVLGLLREAGLDVEEYLGLEDTAKKSGEGYFDGYDVVCKAE